MCLDAANPNSYPGSGTVWTDIVDGIGANLINGPTYDPSDAGSIVFDNTNDYCQVVSNGQSQFAHQSFTIESWVKPDTDSSDSVIFSYDYTSHTPPYYAAQFRLISGGRIYFSWNNNGVWTSNVTSFSTPNNTYVANEWQHIVAVFTSGRQEIRINGILADSDNKDHTITYYNQPVWVGRANYSTSYFDGRIAMVKYYTTALSAEEVLLNYNSTKHRYIK